LRDVWLRYLPARAPESATSATEATKQNSDVADVADVADTQSPERSVAELDNATSPDSMSGDRCKYCGKGGSSAGDPLQIVGLVGEEFCAHRSCLDRALVG
jgi:hypothetical protein